MRSRSNPNVAPGRLRAGAVLALLAILSLAARGAVQAQTPTWLSRCVDCPKFFQGIDGWAIRVDAAGTPHIAYGGDHLYYAWRETAGWNLETVDTSPGVGGSVSLDLDEHGYPHVAYAGFWNNTLRYAYKNASGWHRENLDTKVGGNISLALDQDGHAHISYYDAASDESKLAYQDSTGWHFETISSGGSWGSSLAVDPLGRPHLAYTFEQYYLNHAYRDGSGWHVETVPGTTPYTSVLRPSLAIDGHGHAHISYLAGQRLAYAYQDTTAWHVEEVPMLGYVGPVAALAVSTDGRPHISFYGDDWLQYATKDAGQWHFETVDKNTRVGVSSSITLDGGGLPHIACLYEDNIELRYTSRDAGGTWHSEPVDNGAAAGSGTSLALDVAGYSHISHTDYLNGAIRYAYQDGTGWHVEVADETGGVITSLALDGNGNPHIAHATHYPDYKVRYAYRDAMGWHSEVVGDTNQEAAVDLVLDQAGNAHLAFTGHGAIYYAYRDSQGWHSELVDSAQVMSGFSPITLILDNLGRPHVGYSDTDYHLRHATKVETGWQIEVVDLGVSVESRSSIVIDAQGYLHVVFHQIGQETFTYAYQDASGLHFESVAEGGSDMSLVLGSDGHPRFSYALSLDLYSQKFELRYAYRDAFGWHHQLVDAGAAEGTVGLSSSLVLDGEGTPRISYWDGGHDDLKHAVYAYLEHALYLPLVQRQMITGP